MPFRLRLLPVRIFTLILLTAAFNSVSFGALTIDATYLDTAGETWTADRLAVFEQAISDWESVITGIDNGMGGSTSITLDVDVDFTSVGTDGYLGQFQGGFAAFPGDDIRPWSSEVSREIHFNASLFSSSPNKLGFDPTPGDDGSDKGFNDWDAVSVARHEIGHMLGFSTLFDDDVFTIGQFNQWEDTIINDVFDPAGLNVPMQPGDPAHVAADSWLMDTTLSNAEGRVAISVTEVEMLSLVYGYTISVVPEPSGVLALACVGGALATRRRRSV